MAFLSNLLSVSEPSGMWISIIKAFEGATKNYVLAIILLTVVIRVVWAIVETFSKYSQQKMNSVQAKLQPEMEKLQQKYANQPDVLKQKQNELYQRHMGKGYYGSCLITMLVMVLNLVIFFTLFSGLNSMAGYKISASYDNLKYDYVNSLYVASEYLGDFSDSTKNEQFKDYESLDFVIATDPNDNVTYTYLIQKGQDLDTIYTNHIYKAKYTTDFSRTIPSTDPEVEDTIEKSNKVIIDTLINKFFPLNEDGTRNYSNDVVLSSTPKVNEDGSPVLDEEGVQVYETLYLSQAVQNVAMNSVIENYDQNKDSFLWIENIWLPDSPTSKSMVSYSTLKSQIGEKNIEEGEERIYNAFMTDLKIAREKTNGYFILPLLCVLFSMLSICVTNLYNKHKFAKKGMQAPKTNKIMMIVMPVILGLFAMFYNSVFAIYMVVGQIVSTIIQPLQLLIIDKIIDGKKKKEEEKVIVDYSRKF